MQITAVNISVQNNDQGDFILFEFKLRRAQSTIIITIIKLL